MAATSETLRRLLILSYYFPPMGMGGTQRIAKFCKYLPRFGWQPIVITIRPTHSYFALDNTLVDEVHHVHVERTDSLDPLVLGDRLTRAARSVHDGRRSQLGGHLARLGGWLIPDSKVGWIPFAIRRAKGLLKNERFDALLVSSPPHSSQLAGAFLKQQAALPWVADFRDRWSRGEFQYEPTPLHRLVNLLCERKIAKSASAIVCVTHGLRSYFASLRPRGWVTCIYNGYDPEDFELSGAESAKKEADAKFRLTFVGAVTEVSWPIDLLRAVAGMEPDERRELRVSMVGADLTGKLRRTIQELGVQDVVAARDYLPHRQAVGEMVRADALFLSISRAVSSSYVPGKLFEYLASRRPILASVPEGETDTLLRAAGAAWISRPGDADGLRDNLRLLRHLWHTGVLPVRDPSAIRPYSRVEQTQALAELLDELVVRRSAIGRNVIGTVLR